MNQRERRALLQVLSGLLLLGIVVVFYLDQTGKGARAYAGETIALCGDITAGTAARYTLYLDAASYELRAVGAGGEEVLLAAAVAEERTLGYGAAASESGSAAEPMLSGTPRVYLSGQIEEESTEELTEERSGELLDGLTEEGENGAEAETSEDASADASSDASSNVSEEAVSASEGASSDASSDTSSNASEEAVSASEDASDEAAAESAEASDAAEDTNDPNAAREQGDPEGAATPAYVPYSAAQIKTIIRTRAAGGNIDALVAALADCPDDRARVWEEIFAYWSEVNRSGFINRYDVNSGAAPSLPAGLPTDDSLCFVVLGCGLNADGSIRPEMVNRATTALRCAEQYPNAYLLCTGGHTASGNWSASEGGVMGAWLIEHGVDASRVIIEDASYQTCENAMKSVPLLKRSYPQVSQLVLVTSDYHVPLGAITLQAECLLDGGLSVVANVGCGAPRYVNFSVHEQGKQLEKLAFTVAHSFT